jgi:hypothetical protein
MKKITNREEANHYYDKVNKIVDEYITKWKVRPSELKNYFSKNMKRVIETNGLGDVDGIEKVFSDVVGHRHHMELDGVMKFENFKVDENVLNIGNSTIEHEKILADFYNTSVGHVEKVDDGMHIYSINDFGKKVNSIIFSDEEVKTVYKNIEDRSFEETRKKILSIKEIESVQLDIPIKIMMSEVMDEDKFRSEFKKKVDKDVLILIIKKMVQKKQEMPVSFRNDRLEYRGENRGYHIWEVR